VEVIVMKSWVLVVAFLPFLSVLPSAAPAQLATQGTVLDHLAGDWVMTGTIAGDPVVHDVDSDWVLAGHYLRFHDFSREREESGARAYEATVYIGWDAETERFVCLWLDVTGGEGLSNGVLGYAAQIGDTIPWVFDVGEYQIHNTFVYHREADRWEWTILNVSGGERSEFAHVTLKRRFEVVPGDWSAEQRQILDAIARLSAATAPGGGGADDYAAMLTEDFSRWTIGSDVLNGKQEWVDGVREWFDDGWRVSDRQAEVLEITVEGGTAFSRRIVSEVYAGPDGETAPPARAALDEVWRRDGDGWRLQRVTVQPLEE
jgi:ketosteroid isomerase-like protein